MMDYEKIRVRDWYALGCTVSEPYWFEDESKSTPSSIKYGASLGVQALSVLDIGSHYFFKAIPLAKVPGFFTAAEIKEFLQETFAKHGPPHCGVVMAPSVWRPSKEWTQLPEMERRGELLERWGIDIPGMPRIEADAIEDFLTLSGLKVHWDSGQPG
jgi:hypothetical protein